ncbi:MAG: zinc-finger domain-containing protein [Geminicoccaceae bacterium]
MASEEVLLVEDREVVITDAMNVRCDGGSGPLGHPREFMTLEKEGQVICKYCGRRYVHVSNAEVERIRAASRPFAA